MNTRLNAPPRWFCAAAGVLLTLVALPTLAQQACNGNPTARINPAHQTNVPETTAGAPTQVTLNGSGSTPNNVSHAWVQLAGPAVVLANASSATATFQAPSVGLSGATLTFRLTVTCGTRTDTAQTNITITDVATNAAPTAVATASPEAVAEGGLVTLDGSGSYDIDNTPPTSGLSYLWEQIGGDGTVVTDGIELLPGPTSEIVSFVAPNQPASTQGSTLRFRLTVRDNVGLSGSADTEVTVLWLNDPPRVSLFCPETVDEGAAVLLDGSGSYDTDDGIVAYEWTQESGLPVVDLGQPDPLDDQAGFIAPALGYNQLGSIEFALTVRDATGDFDRETCKVFIRDTTPPAISVPADLEAEATSAAGAPVPFTAYAQDAVEDEFPYALADTACVPSSGSLFALDVLTPVLCRASDSAGNEGSAGFSISVVDTTAPVIASPLSIAVEATGPEGATADFQVKSTDAVDGEQDAECSPASGSIFPINAPGPLTTVTCDATDAHGNVATPAAFTVAVHDTTPPAFDPASVPTDIVEEATSPAGAAATFASPSAQDLVDLAAVTVTCTPASASVFPLGETTVTCDAQDSRGNSTADDEASVAFKVTVQDTTPPAIAGVPSDQTVEATSAAGAPVSYATPTAHDVVDGARAVLCSPAPGMFALGLTAVSCSSSDTRGNTASAGFNVSVVDTTAPTLVLPGNLTAEATGPTGAAVAFAVGASDAVDADVELVCSATSGDVFPLGTTPVQCTATDDAGNVASGGFIVTVRDTTAPAISSHANVTATAAGNSSAVVEYELPTAYDLVDGNVAVTCAPASGQSFGMGSTTVNCSAQDSRGNLATSSFAVVVSYNFTGFFQPVDNAPALNSVKAGSAVPVKFSLGGNQGMAIFQSNPASGAIACSATEGDAIEETLNAGGSSLQYDAASGQYIYVWKTEKSWTGQCRILQVKLKDGAIRTALFKFK